MLILCLLLSVLLLVVVLGMLNARPPQHEAAAALRLHAQAYALAEAGLEDFRVKFGKHAGFPPPPSPSDPIFSYSEVVYDPDNAAVGRFQVKVDQDFDRPPYYLLRVTSAGIVGGSEEVGNRVRLYEEIDTCPTLRSNSALPNSGPGRVLVREVLP